MKKIILLLSALLFIQISQAAVLSSSKTIVSYMLLQSNTNLQAIANNPSNYSFTRLDIAFVNPRLQYTSGSNDLSKTGLLNSYKGTLPSVSIVWQEFNNTIPGQPQPNAAQVEQYYAANFQ
jgi:hypothetical protein